MEWDNYTDDENHSEFDNEEFPDDYAIVTIIAVILIICGIIENLLICWILFRKKKFIKSFANFHLLNLALTDIFFRIVATPDYLEDQIISKSDSACKIFEFGKYTTLAVTFALLAGIALDRYIHIVHPFRARTVNWKHSRNLVALSWLYGALCSAPFLYSIKVDVFVNDEAMETFASCYDEPGLPFITSTTVFLVFSFIIPLIFMGVVYSKIVRVLWNRQRRNVINKNMVKTKIRAVKMMVIVVLTYLVTWGPKLVLQTMEAFHFEEETFEPSESSGEDEDYHDFDEHHKFEQENELLTLFTLNIAFEVISLASSVLNPVIFGYYNGSFRQELKNIYFSIKGAKCFRNRNHKVAPRPIRLHVCPVSSETKRTNDSPI